MTQQIQKQTPFDSMFAKVQQSAPSLKSLLPAHMNIDRFVMQVKMALKKTPKLLECSPASVLGAVTEAADLGLDPSGRLGSAYIIPYKGEAKLIPGYRGLIDLGCRSGFMKSANVYLVYEKDRFVHRNGFMPEHVPYLPRPGQDENPGEWYAGWARFKLPGGGAEIEVMSRREIWAIRARSPSVRGEQKNSPWFTDPEEMAKKTILRRGLKKMALSPVPNAFGDKFTKALELDDEFDAGAIESGRASDDLMAAAVEASVSKVDDLADSLETDKKP